MHQAKKFKAYFIINTPQLRDVSQPYTPLTFQHPYKHAPPVVYLSCPLTLIS